MPFGSIMTSRLIRAVEDNTVHLGIPLTLLMENAGKCVSDAAHELAGSSSARIVVVAGKGGNGGDGITAARFLHIYGHQVTLVLLYPPAEVTHPDARLNLEHVRRIGLPIKSPRDPNQIYDILREADIVVDAILGTGARPPLRPPVAQAVDAINKAREWAKVIAVDVPTGVDPDHGLQADQAVKAHVTIAMHYYKPGYSPAQDLVGEIRLCNVGIPPEAETQVGPGHVKHLIPPRPREAKKGDGGKVLVIGGSRDYTGAPALAALAALSAGADLAFVLTPSSIRDVVASYSPELITLPASDTNYLSQDSLKLALSHALRTDSIILGPGLSQNEASLEFASRFLEELGRNTPQAKVVIDADGLKSLARYHPPLPENTVLTPHRGEFAKLAESYQVPSTNDSRERVVGLSLETGATILLKGPTDIICKSNQCLENNTGNPGMSRGGTGDLLSGIVGALLARMDDPLYAAGIAAYVNGAAGDRALLQKGEFYTTLDVLAYIPQVLADPFGEKRVERG